MQIYKGNSHGRITPDKRPVYSTFFLAMKNSHFYTKMLCGNDISTIFEVAGYMSTKLLLG